MIFVPAKYGSSRLPGKNFIEFYNGYSLLQIAVLRSIKSNCGPVVVSSENYEATMEQITDLGISNSKNVIVQKRPKMLAKDPSTILDVLKYCLQNLDEAHAKNSETVAVVLPTSPFNSSNEIRKAWTCFSHSRASKLLSVSVSSKPPFNAWIDKKKEKGEITFAFPESSYKAMQSTRCPTTYMSNGCISIYDTSELLNNNEFTNVIGYKMSGKASMDIDFDHEFTLAKMAFPVLADDIDFINNSNE